MIQSVDDTNKKLNTFSKSEILHFPIATHCNSLITNLYQTAPAEREAIPCSELSGRTRCWRKSGKFSLSANAWASPAARWSLALWCCEGVFSGSQLALQTAMNKLCFRSLPPPPSASPSVCHTDCLYLSVLLSIRSTRWRSRLHLKDLHLVFWSLRGRVSFVQEDANTQNRDVHVNNQPASCLTYSVYIKTVCCTGPCRRWWRRRGRILLFFFFFLRVWFMPVLSSRPLHNLHPGSLDNRH